MLYMLGISSIYLVDPQKGEIVLEIQDEKNKEKKYLMQPDNRYRVLTAEGLFEIIFTFDKDSYDSEISLYRLRAKGTSFFDDNSILEALRHEDSIH